MLKIADDAVTSAKIADNSIMNADINSSANIAQSKINNLTTDLATINTNISAKELALQQGLPLNIFVVIKAGRLLILIQCLKAQVNTIRLQELEQT